MGIDLSEGDVMATTERTKTTLFLLILGFSMGSAGAAPIHPSLIGPSRFVVAADSVDVWIFFTDRGFSDRQALDVALLRAENTLLPNARTRRQKVKTGSLVGECDLPVNADYMQTILDLGARYRTTSRYLDAMSARLSYSQLRQIAELPYVKEIRPVAKGHRFQPESGWTISSPTATQPPGVNQLNYGPSYDQLNQINVVAAHDSGYSGDGVLVCLLDTGFFTDHEALVNQPVVAEWDFINNDPETQNEPGDDPTQHNHGTYTFSTLGGAHDGDLYGPAYGASFILGKTESIEFEQPIEEDWYVAGLEWADSLGAQVVSTSLGYLDWYTFEDLDGNTAVTTIGVDIAVANGIVCVTAAGNEAQTSWGHIIAPADADSVIAIGAVNSDGEIASFSSPGPTYDGRIKPEVCARGVNTWCAVPWYGTSSYAGVSGTSLSTPLVGGVCALLLEAHPGWTPMQVREALMMTASNAFTPDNDYGWGIIDVMAAINYNLPPTIVQRSPEAGTIVVFQDSLQDFWISTIDDKEGVLTFTWWVDSSAIYNGPDSTFSYAWAEACTSVVKVVAEDSWQGEDSVTWEVHVQPLVGVLTDADSGLPADFVQLRSYPNPFNAATTISFVLPVADFVNLSVYDLVGRRVAILMNSHLGAGHHQVDFDASSLASGVYICRITAGSFDASTKLVLLK